MASEFRVSRSSGNAELAGSLATVAIASLGGPLAAGGAALAEVVKHARARYDTDASTRELRKRVTEEIALWASRESFTSDDIRLGLALATETVARFGLEVHVIADLQFDPVAVSMRVLEAGRADDRRYWGTEPHYDIAARAITVTYSILIRQFKANQPLLLPTIQALRASIEEFAHRVDAAVRSTHATLDALSQGLVAAGTAEVMSYLRARIADWDVSEWPHIQAQSAVECRLRVYKPGRGPTTVDEFITTDEALAGQRTLVVLGGPGSGKTWLARRYAREAAHEALLKLEDGASLHDVELPLLTTWDQWTKTPGGPRESLVSASFASGLGHGETDGTEGLGRLQRTFHQPGMHVLMVVDSLDEAADRTAQATRFRELTMLHGWRVIVTSRPAAWNATYRGQADQGDGPTVVELQDLAYPSDVDGFIRGWFAADPSSADRLIQRLSAREELARVAVVPLMLTFYCLLTEHSAAADRPLPARRRDLYRDLVALLLRGSWVVNATGPDAAPDVEYCETLLSEWAWRAVEHRTTAAGLGDWSDTFTQPTLPRQGERRALDHVAPKVAVDMRGGVTRRFVHRTFLEHFVAEHVAGLSAEEAAELLLDHLWFDPDWQVCAPAAIAAHNQRHKGVLFEHILDNALAPATDWARQAARREWDSLLMTLAQESEPEDWTPKHHDLIHECRVRNATRNPRRIARSAHWGASNSGACAALMAALPAAGAGMVGELAEALPALVTTDVERAEVRVALLNALPTAHPWWLSQLVAALPALATTDEERAEVRNFLASLIRSAGPWAVGHLGAMLPALATMAAERAEVRVVLLNALPTANPWAVGQLIGALAALVTTETERAEVRSVVLDLLLTADREALERVVTLLPRLAITDEDRAEARAALLNAMPVADSWAVRHLGASLLTTVTTAAERTEALATLLDATPTEAVGQLAGVLATLVTTEGERDAVGTTLLNALPTADVEVVEELVTVLPALVTTDAERADVRAALLNALPTADILAIDKLVAVLPALVTTEAERTEARIALLNAIPTAGTEAVAGMVEALAGVVATEAERAEMRTSLVSVLHAVDPWTVGHLGAWLPALVTTDVERAEALATVLDVLPNANPWAVGELSTALPALVTTDVERTQVRAALIKVLPTADREVIQELVAVLRTLVTTDVERAEARASLLNAIPTARRWAVGDLVALLLALVTTDAERAEVRAVLLRILATVKPEAVEEVVAALARLAITKPERADALATLLNALPTATPQAIGQLAAVLPTLVTTDEDRAEARAVLTNMLVGNTSEAVTALVTSLRRVSTRQTWLGWLASGQ